MAMHFRKISDKFDVEGNEIIVVGRKTADSSDLHRVRSNFQIMYCTLRQIPHACYIAGKQHSLLAGNKRRLRPIVQPLLPFGQSFIGSCLTFLRQ